jgi:hypothetical protein
MTRYAHPRTFDPDTQAQRLRDIDKRLYAKTRGTLTINQPGYKPRAHKYVPSRSRIAT